MNSDSSDTFREITYFPSLKYFIWFHPSAHVLILTLPPFFYFVKFLASRASTLSLSVNLLVSIGITACFYGKPHLSNWLIIAANLCYPKHLNPFSIFLWTLRQHHFLCINQCYWWFFCDSIVDCTSFTYLWLFIYHSVQI